MKEILILLLNNFIGNINPTPTKGTFTMLGSLVLGITTQSILPILGIIAYSVSIIVGLLTAYYLYCKLLDRRECKRLKKNNK